MTFMSLRGPAIDPARHDVGTYQYMAPEQLEGSGGRHPLRHFCARLRVVRNGIGQARVSREKPGQHCRLRFSRPSRADLGMAPIPSCARARDQNLHGEGSRRSHAKRARRQTAIPLDRRSRIAGRCSRAGGGKAPGFAENRLDSGWLSQPQRLSYLRLDFCLRAPAPAHALRVSILPPEKQTFDPMSVALSPDGTKLAFVATAAGAVPQLWVRALDSTCSSAARRY